MRLTRVKRSDSVSTRNVGDGTGGLGAESVGRPIGVQREGWSVGGEGAERVTGGWVVGTGTSDSVDVGEGTGGLGAGSVGGPSGGGWSVEGEGGGVMGGCVGWSAKVGGWVVPLSLAVVKSGSPTTVVGTGMSDSVVVGESIGGA